MKMINSCMPMSQKIFQIEKAKENQGHQVYLDDDVRIDGQQCDEGRRLFGKQKVNRVQHVQNLILFAAVQPVDDHDETRLLTAESVQALDHLHHDGHFPLESLRKAKKRMSFRRNGK